MIIKLDPTYEIKKGYKASYILVRNGVTETSNKEYSVPVAYGGIPELLKTYVELKTQDELEGVETDLKTYVDAYKRQVDRMHEMIHHHFKKEDFKKSLKEASGETAQW